VSRAVEIERFIWTDHAELRRSDRGLGRLEVEEVVRDSHQFREVNRGDADWRVYGTAARFDPALTPNERWELS
jgi:hypothetical protein